MSDVTEREPAPPDAGPSGGGLHARRIDAAKYDAIHRALLTGLLGNVGTKTAAHEYTGARGRKFHIFPGSGLFHRKPPWVMAAELTETTKLYARTVARVSPDWIERLAEHLVKREHSEPFWHRDSAHVMAFEKVTLYGLAIVHRRRVHYGPIDPKASRELFIRQALVEGEYHTDAPWFRHNRQLVREVELSEAKLRRRDVLVDAQTRFAWYDAKVPAGVYNGPLFEKWRRQAEGRDRRVLFMKREDLTLPVPPPPPELFPDRVVLHELNDLSLPLSYHFEPGHPADGVTLTVPLAVLNQLPDEVFDWLVPGYLEDLIVALLKTLPKELRVQFVPAPDTAKAVARLLTFGHGPFLHALTWQLGRMSGVNVPAGAWQPDAVPDWLRMNFRVVDEAGKTLAAGRDLNELRRTLKVEVRQTFANMPAGPWHRDDVTRWDFGDLPAEVEIRRPGISIKGYPALVDRGEGQPVALRLTESPEAAAAAMRGGLKRLFMLQVGQEIKYLSRRLPGIDAMCLHYAPVGPCDELRRDLLEVIADRALFDDEAPAKAPPVRTRDEFASRAEAGWRRLSAAAQEVCGLVGQALEARHALAAQLSGTVPPLLEASVRDMREQLAHLVPRGFVTATPYPWLRHLPRFLKGIEVRLKKLLDAGAARDAQGLMEIRPLWEAYLKRADRHAERAAQDPALVQYRWMLEELRVSLFAQELKTSVPVSAKRLHAVWAEVKE